VPVIFVLSGKSFSWEKSRANAHPDGSHLKKRVQNGDEIQVKNNLDPEILWTSYLSIENMQASSPISCAYLF
jgi:hypothetical protein